MARILVVDDVKFIARMISQVFEGAGHETEICLTGKDAYTKAREVLPDLIILDLVLPDIDGLEVAKLLKGDSSTHHIPIMMVSAKNDLKTIAAAFAADVAEFVAKPFETEELVEKALMLLGDFRMDYSISDVDQIPTVTVLHDELAVGTLDELSQALRMAAGNQGRPIILDLSRVRRVDSQVVKAVDEFEKRVRQLGEDVQVVRPESGARASTIFPGIADLFHLHDDRPGALKAARRAAKRGGWIPDRATPAQEVRDAPVGGQSGEQIRFEALDNLVLIRLSRPSISSKALDVIRRDFPRSAHVLLLDLHDVPTIDQGQVRRLGKLVDDISLTGRSVKIVNPNPRVTEMLRIGGLGKSLFWMKEKRRKR